MRTRSRRPDAHGLLDHPNELRLTFPWEPWARTVAVYPNKPRPSPPRLKSPNIERPRSQRHSRVPGSSACPFHRTSPRKKRKASHSSHRDRDPLPPPCTPPPPWPVAAVLASRDHGLDPQESGVRPTAAFAGRRTERTEETERNGNGKKTGAPGGLGRSGRACILRLTCTSRTYRPWSWTPTRRCTRGPPHRTRRTRPRVHEAQLVRRKPRNAVGSATERNACGKSESGGIRPLSQPHGPTRPTGRAAAAELKARAHAIHDVEASRRESDGVVLQASPTGGRR